MIKSWQSGGGFSIGHESHDPPVNFARNQRFWYFLQSVPQWQPTENSYSLSVYKRDMYLFKLVNSLNG